MAALLNAGANIHARSVNSTFAHAFAPRRRWRNSRGPTPAGQMPKPSSIGQPRRKSSGASEPANSPVASIWLQAFVEVKVESGSQNEGACHDRPLQVGRRIPAAGDGADAVG